MKLADASKQLEKLLQQTSNKSERKVYQTLMGVISNLGERELTGKEKRSIEVALDDLQLEAGTESSLKQLKRGRNRFMKFLKDDHCLTRQGHYTELGMAFGLLAGTALAPLIENAIGISMGLTVVICLGMFVGLIIGQQMDRDAEKQNRVLVKR
jgi:Flp pilus assembly protein TadB